MLSLITRCLYISSSHPVILIIFILIQTVVLCLILWLKFKIRWFSYIIFLIFLGGLMVLFIYITSLASNELILISINSIFYSVIFCSLLIFFIILSFNLQDNYNIFNFNFKSFHLIYSIRRSRLVILTIIYLLLTLIIVVKISNKFDAPIKNMIFK